MLSKPRTVFLCSCIIHQHQQPIYSYIHVHSSATVYPRGYCRNKPTRVPPPPLNSLSGRSVNLRNRRLFLLRFLCLSTRLAVAYGVLNIEERKDIGEQEKSPDDWLAYTLSNHCIFDLPFNSRDNNLSLQSLTVGVIARARLGNQCRVRDPAGQPESHGDQLCGGNNDLVRETGQP